jgi:hypothetical protein
VCRGKVKDDPRVIGCYVNNTADMFSTISRISCCAPFFQVDNIDEVFNENVGADTADLGLEYMRTGGSYLLHEMMHATKITQTRPLVIDRFFDGSFEKRIYGPVGVAKAAKTMEKEITATNADSYAMFALAMFWKDVLGGLIQPTTPKAAPANYVDLITDNDDNYVSLVVADPPTCVGILTDKPSADQSYVQGKISDHCSHAASAGRIVNSTTGAYRPVGYTAGPSIPASDNDLWISVAFDPRCSANVTYTVAQGDCETDLGIALNGCNSDSTTQKCGGQVAADCALWNTTTHFGHRSTPPNGFPQLQQSPATG